MCILININICYHAESVKTFLVVLVFSIYLTDVEILVHVRVTAWPDLIVHVLFVSLEKQP
jgi:hypothetical protein